jgi:murein DD-endopeptidase MepM/ murein hydrolase activator NlpD
LNKSGRYIATLFLLIVLGSCVAAPSSPPVPVPPRLPVTGAPKVAPPISMVSVGAFKLDRTPQQGTIALGLVPAGTVRLVKDGADIPFASDRRFVIGFGRDHAAVAVVVAYLRDGRTVSDRIAVTPRQWQIENLPTLPRFSQPDAEFQARRPGELAQINAARRLHAQSDGWRQSFIWPARGRISGLFGSQRIYRGEPGAPHSGVDVAGATGTPVTAPADGVVVLAASSPFTLEGNLLMIDHGMGLNSAFLHLSRIDVKVGDVVRQGQRVGAIGMTGRATGPHLHWGMKWNEERVDPERVVSFVR